LTHVLFCFPHAGGSASFFKNWIINDNIKIVPIEYPGHGSKYCMPLCESMYQLIDYLTEELISQYHLLSAHSFSFFGHSMGATVSYELSKALEERYQLVTNHLFISSKSSPENRLEQSKFTEIQLKEMLLQMGGVSEHFLELEEVTEVFFPIIRADLKLLEDYHRYNNLKLRSNATLFRGLNDSVTRESMESWKSYVNEINSFHTFNGNHFYLINNKNEVLDIIESVIASDVTSQLTQI
jgi:medium-chain acyl-[acyl-carrier-protein] hydrolase